MLPQIRLMKPPRSEEFVEVSIRPIPSVILNAAMTAGFPEHSDYQIVTQAGNEAIFIGFVLINTFYCYGKYYFKSPSYHLGPHIYEASGIQEFKLEDVS